MRITDLEVRRVAVNRRGDWLFVQLRTDEGLTGLGEASHGGPGPDRDLTVAAILREHCRPLLQGRESRDVPALTTLLRPLASGLAGATAISACEQALWDIAGKAAGQPVYRLLGGTAAPRIPLYANVNRATDERTPQGFARNAAAAVAEGFKMVKCAPFDGMDRQRLQQPEQQARLRLGLDCIAAIRDAVGDRVNVLVDCHSRFDVPVALEVARELRSLGVSWFEEPVPTADLGALARLRPLISDMELIGGETLFGLAGFQPYLDAKVWDVVMPDVKHCGGIAAAVAIAQAATARGVAVAPHNPSGPVATAASAHVAAALPSFRILEYAWGEVGWRADLVTPAERIEHGELILPTGPGLGVTLDEATLAAHQVLGDR